MSKETLREIGNRNNRMAVAARDRGDFENAEVWLQTAEYYWSLAAAEDLR